ncbi:hypothetical protein N6B35_29700 (plasmid) [Klebsiella michiganensis]|uniref:hypothetical protein n=1 Tax=Klebsiella michiganensis TaxID=1134687 RepID=UPI0021D96DDA|nr:hypothetical protein [Klebsiella michiganensis]UYB60076.1 hypothetical protein N6B35_29700 [Klebsiella michiganensis]
MKNEDPINPQPLISKQLSREKIKQELQKWTGNYFPKSTDKMFEFYIGKELTSSKRRCLHIYLKKETSEDLEFNLVIFPFKIKKIFPVIEKTIGITHGKVETHSNFNVFNKIIKDDNGNYREKVGYSILVESEKGLQDFIALLDQEVTNGNLKEIEQHGLKQGENLRDLYNRMSETFSQS